MIADVTMPLAKYIAICMGIGFGGFMAGVQLTTNRSISRLEKQKEEDLER